MENLHAQITALSVKCTFLIMDANTLQDTWLGRWYLPFLEHNKVLVHNIVKSWQNPFVLLTYVLLWALHDVIFNYNLFFTCFNTSFDYLIKLIQLQSMFKPSNFNLFITRKKSSHRKISKTIQGFVSNVFEIIADKRKFSVLYQGTWIVPPPFWDYYYPL